MYARVLITSIALSLVGTSAAWAQQGKVDEADARAMKKLAEANLAEIEAGKLAAQKAQSPGGEEVRPKDGRRPREEHLQMAQQIAGSQSSAAGSSSNTASK